MVSGIAAIKPRNRALLDSLMESMERTYEQRCQQIVVAAEVNGFQQLVRDRCNFRLLGEVGLFVVSKHRYVV